MKKTNLKFIQLCILTMSFVQMGTNGISSVISDIARAFPQYPTSTIQFLLTFPNIFITVFSVASVFLLHFFSKKQLITAGLSLVMLAGIVAFVIHSSLPLLFAMTGLMGIGIGLVIPIATTLVIDFFEGKERVSVMGRQTSAAILGSILMSVAGGFLAVIHWYFSFLVYLIAVLGLLLTICFLPEYKQRIVQKFQFRNLSKTTWGYCLIGTAFLFLFNVIPTNLSIYIYERSLGGASLSGISISCFLLGGLVMGLAFEKISSKIGSNSIFVGFLLLAVGLLIISHAFSIIIVCVGCLIAGSSISIVMPQCLIKISDQEDPKYASVACAAFQAVSNIGVFLTPLITNTCSILFRHPNAGIRFVFASAISIGLGLILFLYHWFNRHKKDMPIHCR